MKKILFSIFVTFTICLFSVAVYASMPPSDEQIQQMKQDGTYEQWINMHNEEQKLIQESSQALVQSKIGELNQQDNQGISTFSLIQDTNLNGVMPSTGDVKILVLPIEFNDYKIPKEQHSDLQNKFFKEYDSDTLYNDLSVSEKYKRQSYGKLNLSGYILQTYSAPQNREYYTSDIVQLVNEALTYTLDTNNLSQYDLNADGYIDCLIVKWAGPSETWATAWWSQIVSGGGLTLSNSNLKINKFVWSTIDGHQNVDVHEMGHMLGLPDNYEVNGSQCILDTNVYETMGYGAYDGLYFNAYYKYLLEWISEEDGSLVVLGNEDDALENIDLYAVEKYKENAVNEPKAVIFIPQKEFLPFTEFYIAEYRAGGIGGTLNGNRGVVIWHCNTAVNPSGQYQNKTSFLKSVYKSNTTPFKATDLYVNLNEFSSTPNPSTSPTSAFYDDVYTGAYMNVTYMIPDKSTIIAGFREPDLTPTPQITIDGPFVDNKLVKAVKPGATVTYNVKYKGVEANKITFSLTGVKVDKIDTASASRTLKAITDEMVRTIELKSITGEGSLGITIPAGTAINGAKKAPAAVSDTFFVDNTAPVIELRGTNPQIVAQGTPYVELGTNVTDNLDEEPKLAINSSAVNTVELGNYTVTYTATDHAGNTSTATRIVKVAKNYSTHKDYMITDYVVKDNKVSFTIINKTDNPKTPQLIFVNYNGDELTNISIIPIPLVIGGEQTVNEAIPTGAKVLLWDGSDKLRPIVKF